MPYPDLVKGPDLPFAVPDPDVVSIIDAPPTPLASPSPGEEFVVLMHYQAHPPIAMLARPRLSLAGLRLDPGLGGRQRTRRFTGLSVLRISDGSERVLALPQGAQVSVPTWAPDGRRFAFTVDEPAGIGVWTCDASARSDPVQVPGLLVKDVLGAEPPGLGGTVRWSRDGRSLFVLGAPESGAPAAAAAGAAVEPRIEEVSGKRSQMATFTDLLTNAADEDRFEALATTVPLRADPVTGATVQLGPAGLYQYITDSPDGRYLLVYRLQRPFSFRVPCGYFARRAEIWTAAGKLVTVIADLPVSDEVPRMGVPTGPRQVGWDERAPARVLWTEARDGGDPVVAAEHRDAIMALSAPFDTEPELAFLVTHRCLGWTNLDAADALLMVERDRDRRWLTTWQCDLSDPGRNKVIFDLAEDDDYADPGSPMMRLHPDGTRTVRQDGTAMFLRGDGATPEGERPFLDRHDLVTGEAARLFSSPADAYETVLCFAAGAAGAARSGCDLAREPGRAAQSLPRPARPGRGRPGQAEPGARPAPAAHRVARPAPAAHRPGQAAGRHRPGRRRSALRAAAYPARLRPGPRRPAAPGDLGVSVRLRQRGDRRAGARQLRRGSPGSRPPTPPGSCCGAMPCWPTPPCR